ncbi:hypothetical protein [Lignipirellula cremea]|uniref:Uncharacterized protein n=1 Tax=Lignipirellula cremea TaxID=2528010 RepID=A0A518DQ02_9BACT|nr:hypothetical protein [Lignipirellula cremea]QDU93926.1 hypothetical protein Pla8534_17120 [Lignipirellula cremea]
MPVKNKSESDHALRAQRRWGCVFVALIFLLPVAAWIVGLGCWIARTHQQRATVEAIHRLGAFVSYEGKRQGVLVAEPTVEEGYVGPVAADLLARVTGAPSLHLFHKATSVHLLASDKEKVFPLLLRLPHLKSVSFPWRGPQDDLLLKKIEMELPNVAIERFDAVIR